MAAHPGTWDDEPTRGVYEYEFTLSIGFIQKQTRTLNITKFGWFEEEWDTLTEQERIRALDDAVCDWSNDYIETSWEAKC